MLNKIRNKVLFKGAWGLQSNAQNQEATAHGNIEEKRLILHTLGSNITLKDGKVRIEERKPFVIIRNALQTDVIPSQKLEHEEMIDLSSESFKLRSLIPHLMPD